ncbi:MAG TPA: serine/threonine-protein kinase [Thermoanaerobaculia bacterium]|nr:serine/threonine-protein kinase [Thermoanaerobaculia bacterium]
MQSGQRIRDYVLGQKIGTGGMGEVWSAMHDVLHRPVAIKAMAPHLAADPQFEERFLQEARALAILQHPRILGVTDFFREGGVYYLVMPLVTGRPLDKRIAEARGPLPIPEAASIASDMLDALDYAHQRGIIHRDVKPSNILLDHDGRAYLTDFGIAILVGQDRRTRTGTSLGTPYYMSPEQIRTPKKIDHRSDVYSAACVIYEMLAGRPPFLAEDSEGDTDFVLKEAHLQRSPEPIRRWNPTVPAALDAVVLRGLAKEPDQRYGGCGEFRRALEATAAGMAPPQPAAINRPAPPLQPLQPPPLPAPAPVYPLPPPIPQPVAAPRKSRSGFLLGIGCGVALAVAALVAISVTVYENEEKKKDNPPVAEEPATTAVAETETTVPPPAPVEPVDPAPSTVPATAPDTSAEVASYLESTAEKISGNYRKTADFYLNNLALDGTGTLDATLTEGIEYAIVGQCDHNCSDLDLSIYDGETMISQDLETDDHPVLIMTAPRSDTFRLVVTMAKCSTGACSYGIGLFAKNAAQ